MFLLELNCAAEERDILIADLWEAGSSGIVEVSDTALRAFFDDDELRMPLQSRFGGDIVDADTRDWVAFAREHLQPMEIGERLFVIPEWREEPTPPGRIRIVINAGLAFGTGAHETTRMCLEAIERNVQAGMTVVDIGTGSGILCEAALRLGAARAVASDTDLSAVEVAKENFERAEVSVGVFAGSADSVGSDAADLLMANISPAWISELAPEWMRILRGGGVAILSGFEAADVQGVRQALERFGGVVTAEHARGEWRMLEVRRRA